MRLAGLYGKPHLLAGLPRLEDGLPLVRRGGVIGCDENELEPEISPKRFWYSMSMRLRPS